MANLFILPSLLGDTILTTGGIDHYNDEPAVIITASKSAGIFEDLPHLERLIILDKKPWKKHWFDIWRETRKTSWNRVFDLKGSATSFLLKAKKRYIWTHTDDREHKIHQISRVFGSETPLPPTIWTSKEREARFKPKRPTLAVAPVPGWRGKQWPIENFIELLQKFCKTYPEAQVAVFAAPHEKSLALPLLEALPKDQCVDTIGGPLIDSAAFIKSCRLFIGNDSGLMHLSSAIRTPTIALFGPSNEKIYGPWSHLDPSPHRTLRGDPFAGNVRQTQADTSNYMGSLKLPPVWEVVQERWENLEK
jgi:ADP-heptose:LPS heptosyltransferase